MRNSVQPAWIPLGIVAPGLPDCPDGTVSVSPQSRFSLLYPSPAPACFEAWSSQISPSNLRHKAGSTKLVSRLALLARARRGCKIKPRRTSHALILPHPTKIYPSDHATVYLFHLMHCYARTSCGRELATAVHLSRPHSCLTCLSAAYHLIDFHSSRHAVQRKGPTDSRLTDTSSSDTVSGSARRAASPPHILDRTNCRYTYDELYTPRL